MAGESKWPGQAQMPWDWTQMPWPDPNAVARPPKCRRMAPEWLQTQFWPNAVENSNAVAWKVGNRQWKLSGRLRVVRLKKKPEIFSSPENIFSSSSSWRPCDFPYKLSLICKGISSQKTQNRPPPNFRGVEKIFSGEEKISVFFSRTTRSLLSFPLFYSTNGSLSN